MKQVSKILSPPQVRTILRVGDLLVPQFEEFPSFSQLGCIEYLDDILIYTSKEDLKDLKLLLSLLSFFPVWLLSLFLKCITGQDSFPNWLGTPCRLVDFALRGIVLSLYYSGKAGEQYQGKDPLELIDYQIHRLPK